MALTLDCRIGRDEAGMVIALPYASVARAYMGWMRCCAARWEG